ncbi:hypothetical protein ES703_93174 [subsurface metagenome]
MAKLTRDELENVTGEGIESLLKDRRVRLSTTPFGAAPGKVIAYVSRSVPWKKRGKVPRKLHLAQ